jgi:glycosyltransferase involved in cell wall biosynthesis
MKLVSAIMPTRGRPEMAQQALECFLAQTYPHKELIIADDSDDPSFPGGLEQEGVHYLRANERFTIPVKRNKCCQYAKGSIICHWDSDDWSAPERMADQVARLERCSKMVTGYHSILFYEPETGRIGKYVGYPMYAVGTSLAYTRWFWSEHAFNEGLIVREDNHFVTAAMDCQQIVNVDADQLMVARVHAGNTDPKSMDRFEVVSQDMLPKGFPR